MDTKDKKSPDVTKQSLDSLDTSFEELEDRIAPRIVNNHNETLVNEKLDVEIEELEAKIAPKIAYNHNESLVQDELA